MVVVVGDYFVVGFVVLVVVRIHVFAIVLDIVNVVVIGTRIVTIHVNVYCPWFWY